MAENVGKSMRFDRELNQMLKRLLISLQDYETTLGPLVKQSKIIKSEIKKSLAPGQKLTNRELKKLIGEKLTSMGANPALDYSAGNYQDLGRTISSLLATNPGAWGDIIEESLIAAEGGDLFEAAKKFARYQSSLVQQVPFMVGHHEQGLRGYRAVLEYLEDLPDKSLRERVLHILETRYGANFGEEGLRYLFPFAHKGSDIGPLNSTKPSPRGGVRKDIRALFDEAFPDVGGFHNLDQINPNLRKLIKPLIAHSTAAHGTGGYVPGVGRIKGLTDANEIADILKYYVYANRASYANAKALHDVIWEHGVKEITLPDGTIKTVLRKEAWEKGSVLENVIRKLPITQVAEEGGWGLVKVPRPEIVTEFSDEVIEAADMSRNLPNVSYQGGGALTDFKKAVELGGGETVQKGGKWFRKVLKNGKWTWIPVVGVGISGFGLVGNVQAAIKDPSKHNLAKAGASAVEFGAEGVSAVGILASPFTGGASLSVVPVAETISTAAGAGELGVLAHEYRKQIGQYGKNVWEQTGLPHIRGRYGAQKAQKEEQEEATQLKNRFIKPEEEEEDKTWSNQMRLQPL